jgi:hypothetical protein
MAQSRGVARHAEHGRRPRDRQLARRLARARTAVAQRNVLLDAARRTVARSSDTLAAFSALQAPRSTAAVHRRAAAGWQRNVDRVTVYIERLDRARDRRGVVAAVELLSRQRSALARDALSVRSSLQELGGESCDIERPRVPKTVTLPAAPTPKPTRTPDPTATVTGSVTQTPTPTPRPVDPIDPRVNTPHPNQPAPTRTPTPNEASAP